MSFLDKIFKGNTLYYPGCVTKGALPDIEKRYHEILKKINIEFVSFVDKEYCCGSPLKNAGYKKDLKFVEDENKKVFDEHSIKNIVTNCPGCYNTLKASHPELTVEHITLPLHRYLKKQKPQEKTEKVIYHDPCHLGRQGKVYQEPREALEMLGYEIEEIPYNRKNSLCCGGGGGVKANYTDLSNNIAEERFQLISELSSKTLVTPCPMCYLHFTQNTPEDIKVVEYSELVLKKLK